MMLKAQRQWPQHCDFEYVTDVFSEPDEETVWCDSESSLTISKVGHMGNRHYRLRPGDWMFVDILSDHRFVSRAREGTPSVNCDHFLADQVIPRSIAHQGKLVLHAGAIGIGDGAVLLLGASGRGKSTMSASFATDGYDLLGDDAIMITVGDDKPHAEAVYPSLRLYPDSIAAVLPPKSIGSPMADYSNKQRIDLPGPTSTKLPIRAAFIIEPPSRTAPIVLGRMTVADACMSFVGNSFALDPSDTILARGRLEQASVLARSIPVFGLSYPRDYARLPEVRQAILDQVASLDAL